MNSKLKAILQLFRRTQDTSSASDIPSDVLGSYTGKPKDDSDEPVQDADDL